MYGLSEKQLSFLLHVGCDTDEPVIQLQTQNVLSVKLPSLHVLTGYLGALHRGTYAWRHDSVLLVLVHEI